MAKKKEQRRALALGGTALTVLDAEVEAIPIAPKFRLTVNKLVVDGQPSKAACIAAGVNLRIAERVGAFAIGDFVNYVEGRFGEEASQILDADSGWSLKTIGVYGWLASRVAPERRRMDRLGVRHHMLVAPLSPKKQNEWLIKACAFDQEEPWTVAKLKRAMEEGGDAPDTEFYVEVKVPNGTQQGELMDQLEQQGLACRAINRKTKKELPAATEAAAQEATLLDGV